MIPQILHVTSRQVPLVGSERGVVEDNLAVLGPEWRVMTWSDAENARLVASLLPQHVEKYSAMPFGVMRADVARLLYVYEYGGVYADTDYRFYTPLPAGIVSNGGVVLPLARDRRRFSRSLLGNAVLLGEPGHAFWLEAARAALNAVTPASVTEDQIIAATGPVFLSRFARKVADSSLLEGAVYPERALFHPPQGQRTQESIGGHLTAGTWRSGMPTGMLAKLKARTLR